jgi:hypothetical protein
MAKKNSQGIQESETKKCKCGKPAVGVISTMLAHKYVCREHAEEAEAQGLKVDYDNWRL